jgi:hypothetical protein
LSVVYDWIVQQLLLSTIIIVILQLRQSYS